MEFFWPFIQRPLHASLQLQPLRSPIIIHYYLMDNNVTIILTSILITSPHLKIILFTQVCIPKYFNFACGVFVFRSLMFLNNRFLPIHPSFPIRMYLLKNMGLRISDSLDFVGCILTIQYNILL